MNVSKSGMGWIGLVAIFVLLTTGCSPETPVTLPSPVTSEVVTARGPEITAESTLPVTPSPAVTASCARGDYFEELQSSGQARQYLLHVPATYKPEEPSALVLVFHGAGIAAERFEDYSGFTHVADREGFLIVYPQGLGVEPAWQANSRDIQFIRDLIDHLQRRCHVDPNRIYASGHSNGGGMVDRLGCELSDRIAAIGTLSGAYASSGRCSPSRPVAIFALHGTADPIVPYEGVPEWALAWAQRNGCDLEPTNLVRNVLISEKQWNNCRAGADVILYTIQDHGHEWPTELINAGQIIWEFFKEHPLMAETP
jgi:polyhydroxybutyrate depolymerase